MQLDTGSAANACTTLPRFQQYSGSKGQGHNNERLAQEKRTPRISPGPTRGTCALTGILERRHHKAEKVNVQRRNSRRDQFRVLIENADEQGGKERDQHQTSMVLPDGNAS